MVYHVGPHQHVKIHAEQTETSSSQTKATQHFQCVNLRVAFADIANSTNQRIAPKSPAE